MGWELQTVDGVIRGVDTFDCVLPTRDCVGTCHGQSRTPGGEKNAQFAEGLAPARS